MESCLVRFAGELFTLGKADAVGRRHNAVEADLLGVGYGIDEERRESRLAARKQDDYLAAGLEGNGSVEDRLDIFKLRLVNITHLIGVHEARIAHHVTAIREVDGQNRPAAKLDGGGAVSMNLLVLGALEITTKEEALDPPA